MKIVTTTEPQIIQPAHPPQIPKKETGLPPPGSGIERERCDVRIEEKNPKSHTLEEWSKEISQALSTPCIKTQYEKQHIIATVITEGTPHHSPLHQLKNSKQIKIKIFNKHHKISLNK